MHLKKSFCLTHFMLNHSVLIVIQEAITFYVSHHISPYLTILSAFDAEYKVIKVIFFYPFCVKLFHRRLAKRRLIAIRLSSKSRHITLRMNNLHLLYISELTQQMTRKLSDEERRVTCTLRKLVFITSIWMQLFSVLFPLEIFMLTAFDAWLQISTTSNRIFQ